MPSKEGWASKQEKNSNIIKRKLSWNEINLHLQSIHWGLLIRKIQASKQKKKKARLYNHKFYLSQILYLAYLRSFQLKELDLL